MKNVIKLLAVFFAITLTLISFSSCNKENQTDLDYVKEKGTLIVGITDFAPMDYQNEKDEWIGFDADLAKEFAKYLGVDIQFNEITWDYKITELDGKSIDCVWNGMTLTDDVKTAMSTSVPYCNNKQIIVLPKDKVAEFTTVDACKDLQFAVEVSSAGKDMAVENNFKYTEVKDQATAVMEVASGTADAAIIDSLMANAMVGEGTSYDTLAYTLPLNDEEYGVGFRKGSNICDEFNKFYEESKANGLIQKIAEEYKIEAALID